MVPAIHDRDADRVFRQGAGGVESAEPAADDHHVRVTAAPFSRPGSGRPFGDGMGPHGHASRALAARARRLATSKIHRMTCVAQVTWRRAGGRWSPPWRGSASPPSGGIEARRRPVRGRRADGVAGRGSAHGPALVRSVRERLRSSVCHRAAAGRDGRLSMLHSRRTAACRRAWQEVTTARGKAAMLERWAAVTGKHAPRRSMRPSAVIVPRTDALPPRLPFLAQVRPRMSRPAATGLVSLSWPLADLIHLHIASMPERLHAAKELALAARAVARDGLSTEAGWTRAAAGRKAPPWSPCPPNSSSSARGTSGTPAGLCCGAHGHARGRGWAARGEPGQASTPSPAHHRPERPRGAGLQAVPGYRVMVRARPSRGSTNPKEPLDGR